MLDNLLSGAKLLNVRSFIYWSEQMNARVLALSFLLILAVVAAPAAPPFQIPKDPNPDSPHGPLGGKVECHNVGKDRNCECFRECTKDGKPERDKRCGNRCFEDHCKCRTKCQT